MTTPLPCPSPPADRRQGTGPAAGSADWLRLARLARLLSWLTLAWMGIEGGAAIGAAIVAGSVAVSCDRQTPSCTGKYEADVTPLSLLTSTTGPTADKRELSSPGTVPADDAGQNAAR